ncbi:MAG: UDP-N-acetylmuramate dehydrogenase [Desulfobacteraceae bacterium]|nr:UDP-N-acetylmuramate dehydrogenase [Desulfobacteraceae bacterium]
MENTKQIDSSFKKLKENFNLLSDEPMKNHTSIKVGGPADLFATPETKEEFINLVTTASKMDIAVTIIGDGTNLLIRDKGIRGLVISTSKFKPTIKQYEANSESSIITASAGTKLSTLCNFAINNNLQGLEFAMGIPGTLGGAVFMNAGTPAGSISNIVNSVEIITSQGDIEKIKKSDLKFSYRNFDCRGIITEISFLLNKGNLEEIKNHFNKSLNNKKTTQPLSHKSAGCIFKNPEKGDPAGKLIDMAGLKGKQIGDAVISDKHANFIVNLGNAKCEDILKLIDLIIKKISTLFSVELQTEIIILGE